MFRREMSHTYPPCPQCYPQFYTKDGNLPSFVLYKFISIFCADMGNRTPICSMARSHFTTKLYPRFLYSNHKIKRKQYPPTDKSLLGGLFCGHNSHSLPLIRFRPRLAVFRPNMAEKHRSGSHKYRIKQRRLLNPL